MADLNLDETDFELLRRLDREGDIDAEATSEDLGVSTSTIYYRLEKYREQGILEGTVSDLNARELGFELTVMTEINSTYGPGYDEIGERLADLSGVRDVYFMVGEKSFMLRAHLRNHDHLQKYIDSIIATEGVEHSATHVVLKNFKEESRLLVNYDDEDLQSLIDGE